ncbi:MAG: hypothetical protein ABJP70_08185 [Erythrobacter sp.]
MRSAIIFFMLAALCGCEGSSTPRTDSEKDVAEAGMGRPNSVDMIGHYLCTVAEKASIESLHLEGSAPPNAVSQSNVGTKFRIHIFEHDDDQGNGQKLIELPYDGPGRDPTLWQTQNSVLHSPYAGVDGSFQSTDAETKGVFILAPTVHSGADGELSFHHSGFEWLGGEDNFLSIRWGRCKEI